MKVNELVVKAINEGLKKTKTLFINNRDWIGFYGYKENPLNLFDPKKAIKEDPEYYSTLQLIEDLKIELAKHPEVLALLFPNSLYNFDENGNVVGYKYNNIMLSKLWGYNNRYVQESIVNRVRKSGDIRIKEKGLILLEEKLEDKLGVKALGCIRLVRQYRNLKSTTLQFIHELQKELGRVSGDIKVTDQELSQILMGSIGFIADIKHKINNRKLNYKFSLQRLQEFAKRIQYILGENAFKCLDLINKYKKSNPDLKEYPLEQVTIADSHYFDVIDNLVKFYLFGFLCGDVCLEKSIYRITFSLATKDRKSVEKFALAVGFDLEHIDDFPTYRYYKGELKTYYTSRVKFISKQMASALERHGLFKYKIDCEVPDLVKNAVERAKEEAKGKSIHWSKTYWGILVHAWLLGVYDAEGHYNRGTGMSAYLTSSSKKLLEEIKEFFEIRHNVRDGKPREREILDDKVTTTIIWRLTFGVEVFEHILTSYDLSMSRKRPLEYRKTSKKLNNFLGDNP